MKTNPEKNRGASLTFTILLIVLLCAAGAYVSWKYYLQPNEAQARAYDQAFARIERGMFSGEVTDCMGVPTSYRQGDEVALTTLAWNSSGYGQGDRCDTEYVYHIPWSPFHSDWIIGFDKQGRVTAKYHGN